jgi:hypothetical protein
VDHIINTAFIVPSHFLDDRCQRRSIHPSNNKAQNWPVFPCPCGGH